MVKNSNLSRNDGETAPTGTAEHVSKTGNHDANSRPSDDSDAGGWMPSSSGATVAGFEVGGMVYVGTTPMLRKPGSESMAYLGTPPMLRKLGSESLAYIDPSLPVADVRVSRYKKKFAIDAGYGGLNPGNRASYLHWLENARYDKGCNECYVQLYFFGLERRYFFDNSSEDERREILEEVKLLRTIHSGKRKLGRKLDEFIVAATASAIDPFKIKPDFELNKCGEMPLKMKIALGARIGRGERLSADWVLSWYLASGEADIPMDALSRPTVLRTMFSIHFYAEFPAGLEIERGSGKLAGTYRATSGEFEMPIEIRIDGKPVSDISEVVEPVSIAEEILDMFVEELVSLMPDMVPFGGEWFGFPEHSLKRLRDSAQKRFEKLERVRAWASKVDSGGGVVALADLLEQLHGTPPSSGGRKRVEKAAEEMQVAGYGFAPDPSRDHRVPALNEYVAIFKMIQDGDDILDVILDSILDGDEKLGKSSGAYFINLCRMSLMAFIANADGNVSDVERRLLEKWVGNVEGLLDQEWLWLGANLKCFFAAPPKMRMIRPYLFMFQGNSQMEARKFMVSTALAGGGARPGQVAGMEKIYQELGIDPTLAYSDLNEGTEGLPRSTSASVWERFGKNGSEAGESSAAALDIGKIEAIRSDTDRVSAALGRIFNAEFASEEASDLTAPSTLPGLDEEHVALVRDLVARKRWTEEDFGLLCERRGLLASGALETVNEWAFEIHGEALLEEGDGYEVSSGIAETVKRNLEEPQRGSKS